MYFLIPSPFPPIPQPISHLATAKMFSVFMSLLLFRLFICCIRFFFFYIPHINEILSHLCFFVWLTLLSIIPSGFVPSCCIWLTSVGLWCPLSPPLSVLLMEAAGLWSVLIWSCPLGALALEPPRRCRPRSATICVLFWGHSAWNNAQMVATYSGFRSAQKRPSCKLRLVAATARAGDT